MKDISLNDRLLLTSSKYIKNKNYWTEQLASLPLQSTDQLNSKNSNTSSLENSVYKIDRVISERLLAFCKGKELAVYVYMLSAFSVLLKKYTKNSCVLIWSPSFSYINDVDDKFQNTALPIVLTLNDTTTFKQLLNDVRKTVSGAFNHQNYPLEQIYYDLKIDHGIVNNILLSCDKIHKAVDDSSLCPLKINLKITDGQIMLETSVSKSFAFSLEFFLYHLSEIIENSITAIDLPIGNFQLGLNPEMVNTFNSFSRKEGVRKTQHSQISTLIRNLDKNKGTAIKYQDVVITYKSLTEVTLRCSSFLDRVLELKPGNRVAVLLNRNEFTPIIFLTLLQSGLVYVPIDIDYPTERVRFMLSDISPAMVITEPHLEQFIGELGYSVTTLSKLLDEKQTVNAITIVNVPETSPAYIIYTSGSTGRPKGVEVTRANLSNFIDNLMDYAFENKVLMPFLASCSFDISIFQMLLPLVHGGSIVVVSQRDIQDMNVLSQIIKSCTVLDTVPAVYSQLIQYITDNHGESDYNNIQHLYIGGDAIGDDLLLKLPTIFTSAKVTVTYGPTEGTVFCSSITYDKSASNMRGSILGRPIKGTEVYILDTDGELVPIGVDGEICIGGLGVSSGYRNLSDVTSCRFVRNKYGEGSLYLSGDRGRWTSSGELEFRGRLDEQVKIRGYRIEPGEVERSILSHPDISSAIVQAEPGPDGLSILRGYYTERQDIQLWPSISEYLGYNEIAYYAMNNDFQRADSYRRAIASKVKGLVVVDVGTGPEAILARHCLDSGALRVYAIEILEDVYERARDKVLSLGLSDRIIVLHGDVHDIELPEAVDYCVCALVGNLGSSDGCIPIMNSARRLLKDSSKMIPERSVTYMAAVDFLTKPLRYELTETGVYYMNNIFEGQGSRFDMRMCVQGIKESDLMSAKAIFEDLDLCSYQPLETETGLHLAITRPGLMSGFVLWLHLQASAGIENDILQSQQSFMPVYFPVFSQGLLLETGDIISGNIRRLSVPGTVYPDYEITGSIFRGTGLINEFSYQSLRLPGTYKSNAFYESLFGKTLNLPLKQPLTSGVLRSYLEDRLPGYMVPGSLIKLEKIPLTSNGKVDRKQLREGTAKADSEKVYIAPSGIIAIGLSRIWSELLGVSPIGMQSDFFELGGHSLLATRVVSAVRSVMGYELSIRDIFKYVTLETLSAYITTLPKVMGANTITIADRPAHIPLSFGQERLWFIDRLEGSTQYHIPSVLRVRGDIDKSGLQFSFQQIINRHEILRTFIKETHGTAYQYIGATDSWKIDFIDFSKIDISKRTIDDSIEKLISKPFDLAFDHKLRVELIKLSETEHILIITLHHIASDGWSMPIMIDEFIKFYQSYKSGKNIILPALKLQYVDYALWQRNHISDEVFENSVAYWKEKLSGIVSLDLPTDYPRPAIQSKNAQLYHCRINRNLQVKLQELSKQEGATMFMTLLAAFNVLLYRYSGCADICVGTAIAGRQQQELEGMIGFFVNTLALRNDLSGNPSFRELLASVRETTMDAYAHQDMPFERVVDAVVKERDTSKSPLFQVMFALQNNATLDNNGYSLAGLEFTQEEVSYVSAKFDLLFSLFEDANGIDVGIEYCSDLFSEETIIRLANHYQVMLDEITFNPSQLIGTINILDQSERSLILGEFSGKDSSYPESYTILTLFESQVLSTPDNVALFYEGSTLSYLSLNNRSNQLAHYLLEKGLTSEELVCVCVPRGLDMIVSLLGILKAGGCYVPIDSDYPSDRISYILTDSSCRLLVCNDATVDLLPTGMLAQRVNIDESKSLISQKSESNVCANVLPSHLAYVIYTSGSTGHPKGVMIEHRNVVRLFKHSDNLYDFTENDVWTLFHSYSFDFSVWEMYGALFYGGKLVIVPREVVRDVSLFSKLLSEQGVTILNQTPSAFYALQEYVSMWPCSLNVRYVIFGGEALSPGKLHLWRRQYPSSQLINMYGITETTVHVSYQLIDDELIAGGLSIIGKPIPTLKAYILDTIGSPVPIGVTGELHIGGAGLSRGYVNRPELTASRFIENKFEGCGGERLYKTGDIGRWLSDGRIEYQGRSDDQVKIRGYRIETGEVESAIISSGLVSQCVVLARQDEAIGGSQLVAYVVSGLSFYDSSELQAYLRTRLPDYMVPSMIIGIAEFPLTSNGKIDKKLLASTLSASTGEREYVGPSTSTQEQIASIWEALLGVSNISIHDNFFELGGDSIKVIRVVSRLKQTLNKEIKVSDVYHSSTICQLSELIDSQDSGIELAAERQTTKRSELLSLERSLLASMPPSSRISQIYPMSDIQNGMIYTSLLYPELSLYHDQMVYQLKADIEVSLFTQALELLVEKHSTLRTCFNDELHDNGVQIVYDEVEVNVEYEDISSLDESLVKNYVREYLSSERSRPFDLAQAPLWRSTLFKTGSNTIFIFQCHHAILDGWSVASLNTELNNVYLSLQSGSAPSVLTPLKCNNFDFIVEGLLEKENNDSLEYWKNEMSGYKRLDIFSEDAVLERVERVYDAAFFEKLRLRARLDNVSLKGVFLGAYLYALRMLTADDEVTVGLVTNTRPLAEDGDKLLGCFVNTIPFRMNFKTGISTWQSYFEAVERKILELKPHERTTLLEITKATGEQTLNQNPFFDTLFNLLNFHIYDELSTQSIRDDYSVLANVEADDNLEYSLSNTYLNCAADITHNELRIIFSNRRKLKSEKSINDLLGYIDKVINYYCLAPESIIGTINILDQSERSLILGEFSGKDSSYPESYTILTLFESQVLSTPDNVALFYEGSTLSYLSLNNRSNQLAHYLLEKGLTSEELVCVCVPRGLDMIVSLLGILKAGGCYVPIDSDYPSDRISYILTDSSCRLLVCNDATVDLLPTGMLAQRVNIDESKSLISQKSESNVCANVLPSHLAYVIYTSGSTGHPKGVMIEHRNVVRLFKHSDNLYDFTENDVWTLFHSYSFDFSVWEMYGALFYGGKLVIVPREVVRDVSLFSKLLSEQGVTILNQTPSAFYALQEYVSMWPCSLNVRYVIFGGEALSPGKLHLWRRQYPSSQLINMYGITETTVHVSYQLIDDELIAGGLSIIGKPIPTLKAYILDTIGSPVPIGVTGELHIGGAGLSRGYVNRPELTASRFIENKFEGCGGERLYKTGDIGRWLSDGRIEYQGRSDDQVKIRGYRIETGEVESAIISSGLVSQCVVLARQDEAIGGSQLVAYVVSGLSFYDSSELQAYLRTRLPDYMVPSMIIGIAEFPLTSNGKIDKKLLASTLSASTGEREYVGPSTSTQEQIASIWEALLGVSNISIHDNFFELGGDSIKVIRVVSRLKQTLNKEIKVSDVYHSSTICQLSELIDSQDSGIELAAERQTTKRSELLSLERSLLASMPPSSRISQIYPMSDIQNGMIYTSLLYPELSLYHDQMVYQLKADIEVSLFTQALELLVEKHSTLRTCFNDELHDNGVQIVYDEVEVNVEYEDISSLDESLVKNYVREYLSSERSRPFDLAQAPLWRSTLFKTGSNTIFIFQCHHAILDGWSVASLNTELNNVYLSLQSGSAPSVLTPLKCNNFDFIVEGLLEKENNDSLEYWKNEMSGYKRLDIFSEDAVLERVERVYDAAFFEKLRLRARLDNVSLKGVFLGAYLYALRMLTADDEVTVGLVTNTRPLAEDGDKLLGCFVNTIPFRMNFKTGISTWQSYFEAVERKILELKPHERTTLLEITKATGEQTLNQNPFFDTLFDFINFHIYDELRDGMSSLNEVEENDGLSGYILTNTYLDYIVSITKGELNISFNIQRKLKHGKSLNELAIYFDNCLRNYINSYKEAISKETVLASTELQLLKDVWLSTSKIYDKDVTLISSLKYQTAKHQKSPAIISASGVLTYNDLELSTNQLAKYLQKVGVKENDIVLLCIDESEDMIISMWGVMKTGAAYLPVDKTYPEDRVKYIIADSGSKTIITNSNHLSKFKDCNGVNVINLDNEKSKIALMQNTYPDASILPNSLAYVIYTSGSTGKPKGVCVTHKNVINYISNSETQYLQHDKIYKAGSYAHLSYAFDASVTALYMPLLSGKLLVVSDYDGYNVFKDPLFIANAPYDFIKLTPAHLLLLDEILENCDMLITKRLVIGGEALLFSKIKHLLAQGIEIVNEYGPTEATVGCTTYWVKPGQIPLKNNDQLSIGKPISNSQMYVLDKNQGFCPIQVKGELYIGGDGVTAGYLNATDLTSQHYIINPFSNNKQDLLYKTGDICYWDKSGNLMYEGREDDQVKIRGYRVSLTEVESRIQTVKYIKECAVIFEKYPDGNGDLFCFIVTENGFKKDVFDKSLAKFLPGHMLPQHIIELENIPLTTNGKNDRNAMLLLAKKVEYTEMFVAPDNLVEIELASIWCKLLNRETIGIYDNFFLSGGDSLKAMRMVSAIRRQMDVEITIEVLFELNTINAIATYIMLNREEKSTDDANYISIKL